MLEGGSAAACVVLVVNTAAASALGWSVGWWCGWFESLCKQDTLSGAAFRVEIVPVSHADILDTLGGFGELKGCECEAKSSN
jgi:hypothetical protein